MNITSIAPSAASQIQPATTLKPSSNVSFSSLLSGALEHVESAQTQAHSAAMDLLAGGRGDVHTVALATQRAELSLELFQQVKNKFVQAYQEVMKMPM